jgi:hypothetical protein
MLLPGSYKGTRKRRQARPRTLFEIYGIGEYEMPKNKPDDPFEDDWGETMPDSSEGPSEEMPDAPSKEYYDFFKPHIVGKQMGGKIELVRVLPETSEYSDVILLVKFNGKSFRLGLKFFSKEYKALKKRFGAKRSDWHGELRYRVMPHKGNPHGFIAVR